MAEKLTDRIVTTPQGDGVVKVEVRYHGREETKPNYGNVTRVTQAGETFHAYSVASGQNGTTEKFTAAVLAAARVIDSV
jgi:hypothetical protein